MFVTTVTSVFTYLTQSQHAMKKSEAALVTINKAMKIDPKNPLCKFHRASILFSMDKHQVWNVATNKSQFKRKL